MNNIDRNAHMDILYGYYFNIVVIDLMNIPTALYHNYVNSAENSTLFVYISIFH